MPGRQFPLYPLRCVLEEICEDQAQQNIEGAIDLEIKRFIHYPYSLLGKDKDYDKIITSLNIFNISSAEIINNYKHNMPHFDKTAQELYEKTFQSYKNKEDFLYYNKKFQDKNFSIVYLIKTLFNSTDFIKEKFEELYDQLYLYNDSRIKLQTLELSRETLVKYFIDNQHKVCSEIREYFRNMPNHSKKFDLMSKQKIVIDIIEKCVENDKVK